MKPSQRPSPRTLNAALGWHFFWAMRPRADRTRSFASRRQRRYSRRTSPRWSGQQLLSFDLSARRLTATPGTATAHNRGVDLPRASAASLVGCDATHRNHHVVTTVCSRLAPADCSHTTLAGHKAPGGECSAHKEHFFETASSAARAFARHRSDLGLAKPGAKRMGRIRVDRPRASCYGSNRR